MTLDETLKITNRRVNALEYIVIPRIEYTIKYIETELQERSKEEKFKIKKVLYNKKKLKAIEEAAKEKNSLLVIEEVTAFTPFNNEEEEDEEDDDIDSNLFSR